MMAIALTLTVISLLELALLLLNERDKAQLAKQLEARELELHERRVTGTRRP